MSERAKIDWVPCSERLPEESGHYLITALWNNERIVTSDDFFSYGWDDWGRDVIAWAELPEAYEGDK